MGYSVGQVASLAGVTVRTLHHYDQAGLLSPGGRSHAGYRLYGDADLARLQQILFYRELGFSLDEIAVILDDPHANALEHLRSRQRQLREEIARLQRLAEAAERAIEVQQTGVSLTPEERFDVFGEITFDLSYATHAQLRSGYSDAHQEAMKRASAHTKEDWRRLMGEAATWRTELLAAFDDREPADGERAMDLAEEHRRHLTRWFTPARPTRTGASRTTSPPTRAPSPSSYRRRSNARASPPICARRSMPTRPAVPVHEPTPRKAEKTDEHPDRHGRITR